MHSGVAAVVGLRSERDRLDVVGDPAFTILYAGSEAGQAALTGGLWLV
jgi:hypothetical protein